MYTRILIEVTSEKWDWGGKDFHILIYILLYSLKFRCTFSFYNCWLFFKGQLPLLNNPLFVIAGFWVPGQLRSRHGVRCISPSVELLTGPIELQCRYFFLNSKTLKYNLTKGIISNKPSCSFYSFLYCLPLKFPPSHHTQSSFIFPDKSVSQKAESKE